MTEHTQPATPIQIRRQRDFGAILGLVFEFIRANAGTFLKSLLIIVGPAALIAGIGQGAYLSGFLDIAGWMAQAEDPGSGDFLAMFGDLAPMIAVAVVAALVGAVMLFALVPNFVLLYMQRGIGGFDVGDVWASVRQDFWRVLVTLVVTIIIVAIPPAALIVLATMTGSPFIMVPGFILALPLGIYLYNVSSITIPIRVVERVGIGESVRRSFKLISGKWWFTFWLFFVLAIIFGILMVIVQVPMQIVMTATMIEGGEPGDVGPIVMILGGIAGALAQLLYGLFALAATLQYFNLVEIKEGVGMYDRIQEIGGDATDATGQVS